MCMIINSFVAVLDSGAVDGGHIRDLVGRVQRT